MFAIAAAGAGVLAAFGPTTDGFQTALFWLLGVLVGLISGLLCAALWSVQGSRIGRAGRFDALVELSNEIGRVNEVVTLHFLLMNTLTSIMGWRSSALFVLEEEDGVYTCRKGCGRSGEHVASDLTFRRSDQFLEGLLDARDPKADPACALQRVHGTNRQVEVLVKGLGATHLLPLINHGRLFGFLVASGHPELRAAEMAILRAIAGQAAAALETLVMLEKAAIDPLTGFMKPALFDGRLEEEMRRSRRLRNAFSILLIDIDELAEVNRKWGDHAGDEVIRAIARSMREKLRKTDVVCRCSGEEFTVLLPDTAADQARLVAETLRAQIEALRMNLSEHQAIISRTVTIGIAEHRPEEPSFADDLIQRARQALQHAKTEGKNAVTVFDLSMPL